MKKKFTAVLSAALFFSCVAAAPLFADSENAPGDEYYRNAVNYLILASGENSEINMGKAYLQLEKASRAGNLKALYAMAELTSHTRQDLSGKLMALSMYEQYAKRVGNPPKDVLEKIDSLKKMVQEMEKP